MDLYAVKSFVAYFAIYFIYCKLLDSGLREPLQDASKNPSKLPQHCPKFLLHFVPNSPLDVNTNYT